MSTDFRYVRYIDLTVDQAEQVRRFWPNDDPWQYEYVLRGGAVDSRLTMDELVEELRR
jgi:hypothetical protein